MAEQDTLGRGAQRGEVAEQDTLGRGTILKKRVRQQQELGREAQAKAPYISPSLGDKWGQSECRGSRTSSAGSLTEENTRRCGRARDA